MALVRSGLLIALMILSVKLSAQTDSLEKFLYYTSKNQKVDEIYFYSLERKIVRAKQEVPGPLPIYLMDKSNIIIDTLNHKVLPEFVLYGPYGNVYITGGARFESVNISDSVFKDGEQFSAIDSEVSGVKGMWRILKFDDKIVGLSGSGKKMVVQLVDLNTNKKTVLIAPQLAIKIQDQMMIDVNYYLNQEFLFVFIVPYQKLFKIRLADYSVSEVAFPSSLNQSWYFFYDHIKDRQYAVRSEGRKFTLYQLNRDAALVEVTSLIGFPKSIVDDNIHFAKRTSEGTNHFMIPISSIKRREIESSSFSLKELFIKQ